MKSFLAGLGIGIGLGILFAPMSGEETRENLTQRASDLADSARDLANQGRDKSAPRFPQFVDRQTVLPATCRKLPGPKPATSNRISKLQLHLAGGREEPSGAHEWVNSNGIDPLYRFAK